LLIVSSDGRASAALPLPVGVEKQRITEVLVDHLREVYSLLGGSASKGMGTSIIADAAVPNDAAEEIENVEFASADERWRVCHAPHDR
jgi:hypothetical protein